MAQLTCIVVTPEATAVETKADFVVLPLYDGEIGLAAGRARSLDASVSGKCAITIGGKVLRYYRGRRFCPRCRGMWCRCLPTERCPAGEVDVMAAQQQRDEARQLPIATPEQEEIRDRRLAQAQGQLRVARRAGVAASKPRS